MAEEQVKKQENTEFEKTYIDENIQSDKDGRFKSFLKKFLKRKELHMKVVMYGTKACPDCVEAEEILKEKGIQYLYMEFSDNIGYLKRFLTLRDTNPIFDEVKENHWVGVPCFQFQDGSLSLDIDEVVKRAEEEA